MTKRERVAWLRSTSKLPLPDVPVHFGPDPRYLPEEYTDWNQDEGKIYWHGPLADKWDWVAFDHEEIHAADTLWWTDDLRELAKPTIGHRPTDWPWFWPPDWDPRNHKGPEPYCEGLAQQLSRVCMGWVKMPKLTELYLYAHARRLQ